MLGRTVIVAAGSLLLSSVANAQAPAVSTPLDEAAGKPAVSAAQRPAAAEPDPLTPPEVQAAPPSAPMPAASAVPVAPPAAVAAAPNPIIIAIRSRLGTPAARQAAIDPTDRAALAAFYEADGARELWTDANGFTSRARLALDEIAKADDWGLKASAFELPSLPASGASDEQRAEAEIKLGLAILKYARHARGGRLNPPSISALLDRKPQVYDPKTLIAAVAIAGAPDAYLRGLHPKHAGFVNLQKALAAARAPAVAAAPPEPVVVEPPAPQVRGSARSKVASAKRTAPHSSAETIQRIVVNMERWRWMPDDLGAFHVWNNIPDQITTVYNGEKVVFTERIVVGAPTTPTPNFSADMQFVIFQPEWGVPGGIKNNELGPMLRRASSESGGWFGDSNRTLSSVLARHGLRVSNGNQIINPDSIDWSRVDVNRFSFVQPAGPTNVLGVVKFRFPNKHDVYMHDTPQKNLFSASQRAFSHGCMRVQNPVRFAEVLLEHDKGWATDRVRGMVPRGGEVKLSTQIPVHNVYFTAVADETGKLRNAADIYGVDSRMASALEGRSVALASRGDPQAAGGPVPKGEPTTRQARRRAGGTSTAASSGFNIFSGLFGN